MAEVLLDSAQRDPGGGERGRKSVAQVVEADLADTRLRTRRLESTRDLRAIERDWAVPLRDAIARAGGFRISDGFISPLDLVATRTPEAPDFIRPRVAPGDEN